MEKLIHLTDMHLAPPPRRLYGLDPLARLAAAIDDINQHHADASGVFVTGDLTHWGDEAAYQALRLEFDRLVVPCYPVLGNHDVRGAFRSVFPEVPVDDEGFVQYVVPLDAGACLMLDTLTEGMTGGALCATRLRWLERQLSTLANRDLFLFLHHPPFAIGIPGMDQVALGQGAEQLAELLERHGRVRHLFFGHVHRPIAGSWRGIPVSSLPGTNHQVALDFGESEEVGGTHEPPAYGVVFINESSVIVHQQAFLDRSRRFSLASPAAEEAQDPAALPLASHS